MQELKNLLTQNYAISVQSIKLAPRGFVGETYIVNAKNNRYFLKIFQKNRYFVNVLQSLLGLKELKNLGFNHINYPLSTKQDFLYFKDDDKYYVLFNYIEGNDSTVEDKYEVYKELIKIHKVTDKIKSPIKKDDFKIEFESVFKKTLMKYKDIQLLSSHLEDILMHWQSFKTLAYIIRKKSLDRYLTHGDAFGNTIKNNGGLFIIDWDDLLLAPLERDLWFFYQDEKVVNLYTREFPGFHIDQDLILYYIYNRFFDDLLGFLELLESKNVNKEDLIKAIKKDCFDWTYQLIKINTK